MIPPCTYDTEMLHAWQRCRLALQFRCMLPEGIAPFSNPLTRLPSICCQEAAFRENSNWNRARTPQLWFARPIRYVPALNSRTAAWACWSKGKAEQQQPQRTVGWEAILAAHALAWFFLRDWLNFSQKKWRLNSSGERISNRVLSVVEGTFSHIITKKMQQTRCFSKCNHTL